MFYRCVSTSKYPQTPGEPKYTIRAQSIGFPSLVFRFTAHNFAFNGPSRRQLRDCGFRTKLVMTPVEGKCLNGVAKCRYIYIYTYI